MQPLQWPMQVKEVMTRDVAYTGPDHSLQSAAMTMQGRDIGALPVREGDQVIGMLTDRDIVVRAVGAGQDPRTTPVRQAMTPEIICCYDDQDVHQAGHMMEQRHIRRLLVIDRADRPVGIISVGDIASRTHEDTFVGEILQHVVEPHHVQLH
jgi:CBS domain-containing protein